MKYRPEIDGLRAIAVVPVVLFHAGVPGFSGGYLGVDVFFVISGFLITSIVAKQARENRFSVKTFYERRARRLMPALFAMLAAVVAGGWMYAPPRYLREVGESLIAVVLYVSNIVFWRRSDYFATDAELNPLLHTWSLSVEEQFYVLFPTCLVLAIRYRPTLARWFIVAAMLLSFGVGEWASHASHQAAFFLLPARAWELLVGSSLALFPEVRERGRSGLAAEALPAVGLALVLGTIALYDTTVPAPGLWTTLPVLGTALLLGWAGPHNVIGKLLSLGPMVHVGLISYSLYLWHQPLISLARHASIWHLGPLPMAVLIGLSFVAGELSWRFVENPFRHNGRFSTRQVFGGTLTGSALFGAIGVGLVVTQGLPNRYEPAVLEALDIAQFKSDRRCLRTQRTPPNKPPCELGAPDVDPSLWLIGDSHSNALAFGLSESLAERGLAAQQYSYGSCAPVFGLDEAVDEMRDGCGAHNERVLAMAESTTAPTLVLVARWGLLFHGKVRTEHCQEAEYRGGRSDAEIALLVDEVVQSIERWHATGKKIVLLAPTPEFGCNVPSTLAKLRARDGVADFRLERAVHDERSAPLQAVIERLPDDIVVIDPADVLCDATSCFAEADHQILYKDDDHLSLDGSRRVADQVAATLLD